MKKKLTSFQYGYITKISQDPLDMTSPSA